MNTNREGLTPRQEEVLEFVRERRSVTGNMPSTREIQRHFGFASQTAAVNHLKALERKGVLRRLPGDLVPLARRDYADIPILGSIPAGQPAYEEELNEGCLAVDLSSVGIPQNARTFALKARGESMIGAHIEDGDLVIMEFKEPRNGDIVAALIDGDTTLKRFITRNGKPYLKAENPAYPDLMPARELVIQGVMVALLRRAT